MSSYEVDGLRLPDRVAGQPVLDFCNTRAGWNSDRPREYLVAPAVLAVWAGEVGLLGPGQVARLRAEASTPAAHTALRRAITLREALYPILLGRGGEADWEMVSVAAARARAGARLRPGPDGTAHWEQRRDRTDTALLAVAGAAADLLTAGPPGPIAACPGEGCGWLFHDRRQRRRWCSMAVCGNRAKARQYRERSRSD